jgi:hypothetical protein
MFLSPLLALQKALSFAKNTLKLPSIDPLVYKTVVGKYQFQNGNMTINTFEMVAELFKANMKGTIGLTGSQPVNATSQVTLPAVDGVEVVTTMSIKGTVLNPDVNVDKAATGKSILKAISEKMNKDGGDGNKSPEQQLEGLFKGLLKKK